MSKTYEEGVRDVYIAFRSNPSNDHITDGMWCAQNVVQVSVLARIKSPAARETLQNC